MHYARFGPFSEEPSSYAWIIDKDHIHTASDEAWGVKSAVGTIGPSNATDEQIAALEARPKVGRKFKMYDDDGELYYTGRIIGVDDTDGIFWGNDGEEADFGPLWDFGTPNAGATEIRYKNEEGKWQTL